MSVIQVEHLTRDYGNRKGIFDVSFEVSEGEAFGFLGPNGAGKTTTIRHLMGFLKAKSGHCSIFGEDCWDRRERIQRELGYLPGEISFFNDMTGIEFLSFLKNYRSVPSSSREKELIERFELDTRGKIRKMSKGMKQKLAIIAAFIHDPKILILDEPTSGLDPLMQHRFTELIREETERGKTILMSSHIFEEVERTCERVGIIKNGRMMAINSIEELRDRHLRTYRVSLETEELARHFAKDFHGSAQGLSVSVTAKPSLEQIFMHYYGGEEHD